MKIKSLRPEEELRQILLDPSADGPDIAYWVFTNISSSSWKNMTIVVPGSYGEEFPKTYGHYHTSKQKEEISKLISGKGLFMLQKKFYADEVWIPNKVAQVYIIEANEGDEIHIPEQFAHSWSNIGKLPLILYDDWMDYEPHSHTYDEVQNLKGLAYYVIKSNVKDYQLVKNPNYTEHPEPKYVSAQEFNLLVKRNV